MLKNQKGFSLVELVIVIVVVGLLAVAALPRFLDVTDAAKKSSIEGVAGGFAAGMTVFGYTELMEESRLIEAGAHHTFNNMASLVDEMKRFVPTTL